MSIVLKQKITDRIVLGKTILAEASIGKNVEIYVQNGSIVILPAAKKRGWNVLGELGKDATRGKLRNPSEKHNEYLYIEEE